EGSVKLVAADALFAGAKQVDRLQPDVQRDVAGLHDGADGHGERLAADVALAHAGLGALALHPAHPRRFAAARAHRAVRPETRLDERQRGGFVVEMFGGKQGLRHRCAPMPGTYRRWLGKSSIISPVNSHRIRSGTPPSPSSACRTAGTPPPPA